MPGRSRSQRYRSQESVIQEFRANAGRVGGYFTYVPLLQLTTTGARSGKQHTTPLTYLRDEERYVVVAANAGAPRHPDWYHNLVADPRGIVEIGMDVVDVTARIEHGPRRDTLYERFAAQNHQLILYQAGTTRQFPVVTLVPC
jgi:deazaflavin-dependent oxidoreductase (nitroreductase family)